jgi:hypothetical protein
VACLSVGGEENHEKHSPDSWYPGRDSNLFSPEALRAFSSVELATNSLHAFLIALARAKCPSHPPDCHKALQGLFPTAATPHATVTHLKLYKGAL